MENTIIYSVLGIFILACVCVTIKVVSTRKQNNGETDICELIKEYTGLIVSLVNSALEIVKIDKTISLDDYKNQVAIIVAGDLFEELNSNEMDNEIIKKLIKADIINVTSLTDALLKFFNVVDSVSTTIKKNFDKKQKDLELEP